ncbi:MAG TPA: PadR family transcriptional regulator [Nitrososphaerales archaeon]|nr:PadR family transcriptional regulator [Nitrososphaerales archaeon]
MTTPFKRLLGLEHGEAGADLVRFVSRLKTKVQRENLWFFILVLLSSQERYGFELRRLINEEFGFWSGNVTAYRVLYDLEKSGLVRAELKDRRKYYRITEPGRAELDEARSFFRSVLTESKPEAGKD